MNSVPGIAPRYHEILRPEILERLRRAFPGFNRGMLMLWRLGLGWSMEIWPTVFGRLMVIEHTGRKSGTVYRTPVDFTRWNGDVYCIAGFGPKTDWLRNLRADPDIAVWLPDGRWTARAEDVTGCPDHLEIMRRLLVDSGFASRAIGLDPRVISDDALADATATYRLIRITPREREDVPGGPGDLAWIWYPAAAALVLCAVRRFRRSTLGR